MEDWTLVPPSIDSVHQQIIKLQEQIAHLQTSVDSLIQLTHERRPPLVIPGISAVLGSTFEAKRDLNWNIRKGKTVPFAPERLSEDCPD